MCTAPPCSPVCSPNQTCCLDIDEKTGSCAGSCVGSELPLECNDDEDCGNALCCVARDEGTHEFVGTFCRAGSCKAGELPACDPTVGCSGLCETLVLQEVFLGTTVPSPYDLYGECTP